MMWAILVHLDGCPVEYELCRCDTPDSVAAVVGALCRARDARPVTIRRLPDLPKDEPAATWPRVQGE